MKLLIVLDKPTNKTGGLYISFKIQQSASASVIGQRPNFTIADYSASADCENCSFGHCLIGSSIKDAIISFGLVLATLRYILK